MKGNQKEKLENVGGGGAVSKLKGGRREGEDKDAEKGRQGFVLWIQAVRSAMTQRRKKERGKAGVLRTLRTSG